MSLRLFPVPGKEKSKLICKAFAHGAPASIGGDVFFGTEGVMVAWQAAQRRAAAGGAPFWYLDNAYTDPQRQLYFRVTKNALQVDVRRAAAELSAAVEPGSEIGPALPWMKHSDGTRFARLGITVKPWRQKPDGRILVIPQSDDFMKSTLGRKGDWLRETVEKLNAWGYGPRIRVRPWQRDKKTAYVELHRDLDDAAMVVTWSSASAITALYEGIPAISEDGAAHALTGPLTQERVAQPLLPSIAERTRFLKILADNQFTLDEFRDGTAWRWLERSTA